eukprot:TRINITY_DN3694_c0_g1_i2.p1 TRINITY_DN3694_c0_g1~~TRINITY_DN3694_c0_g1_i2.p1  ORF type:complete len:572 (+),score=129.72 TRINITY_DN3694_c0_g1_i2:1831-3546(+)
MIHALASGDQSLAEAKLTPLWHALGVVQHHDSITGTSKAFVYDDYTSQLDDGNTAATTAVLSALLEVDALADQWDICPPVREAPSQCAKLAAGQLVAVYNPLFYTRDIAVTLDAGEGDLCVRYRGLNTTSMVPSQLRPAPAGSTGAYQLSFVAPAVPAAGMLTFELATCSAHRVSTASQLRVHARGSTTTIENNYYRLTVDVVTGKPISLLDKTRDVSTPFNVDVLYYVPEGSPNSSRSGAYVFASFGPAMSFPGPRGPVYKYSGPVFQEIEVTVDSASGVVQRFRLYNNDSGGLEVITTVGPISISDGNGKEVVVSYRTGLMSAGAVYTDTHGLEFIKRSYNVLSGQFPVENPISGNYYPVSSAGYIKDFENTFAVLTDRGQGIASLETGSLELMVHRRLLQDGDQKGAGEPLNDTTTITTTHRVQFNQTSSAMRGIRRGTLEAEHPPVVLYAHAARVHPIEWRPAAADLPENVHLSTLQVTQYDVADGLHTLLRLHHLFAVGEDTRLSEPATVDLRRLFADWAITQATEVSLSGNHVLGRLGNATKITLQPMDVRTFAISMTRNSGAKL